MPTSPGPSTPHNSIPTDSSSFPSILPQSVQYLNLAVKPEQVPKNLQWIGMHLEADVQSDVPRNLQDTLLSIYREQFGLDHFTTLLHTDLPALPALPADPPSEDSPLQWYQHWNTPSPDSEPSDQYWNGSDDYGVEDEAALLAIEKEWEEEQERCRRAGMLNVAQAQAAATLPPPTDTSNDASAHSSIAASNSASNTVPSPAIPPPADLHVEALPPSLEAATSSPNHPHCLAGPDATSTARCAVPTLSPVTHRRRAQRTTPMVSQATQTNAQSLPPPYVSSPHRDAHLPIIEVPDSDTSFDSSVAVSSSHPTSGNPEHSPSVAAPTAAPLALARPVVWDAQASESISSARALSMPAQAVRSPTSRSPASHMLTSRIPTSSHAPTSREPAPRHTLEAPTDAPAPPPPSYAATSRGPSVPSPWASPQSAYDRICSPRIREFLTLREEHTPTPYVIWLAVDKCMHTARDHAQTKWPERLAECGFSPVEILHLITLLREVW
ncbi:hypothetical protein C8Q80DRAFT_1268922 [Daedaleopsis nitida]|nr:hypothetical protein C8Q80DRAFT_1268922 [Daedaleopsis nitida]